MSFSNGLNPTGIRRLITPSLSETLNRDGYMSFPYGDQLIYDVLQDLQHATSVPSYLTENYTIDFTIELIPSTFPILFGEMVTILNKDPINNSIMFTSKDLPRPVLNARILDFAFMENFVGLSAVYYEVEEYGSYIKRPYFMRSIKFLPTSDLNLLKSETKTSASISSFTDDSWKAFFASIPYFDKYDLWSLLYNPAAFTTLTSAEYDTETGKFIKNRRMDNLPMLVSALEHINSDVYSKVEINEEGTVQIEKIILSEADILYLMDNNNDVFWLVPSKANWVLGFYPELEQALLMV